MGKCAKSREKQYQVFTTEISCINKATTSDFHAELLFCVWMETSLTKSTVITAANKLQTS